MAVGLGSAPCGLPALSLAVLQHKALQLPNLHGRIKAAADTGILTGMGADQSAQILQRILSGDQIEGFLVFALGDLLHIGLNRYMMGAAALTGSGKVGLLDPGIAVIQGNIGGSLDFVHQNAAEIIQSLIAVLFHVVMHAGDHGPDNVVAGDQGLGAHTNQVAAAHDHLHSVLPIPDAAGSHDGRLLAADLADLISISLCQRLQPGGAVAAHADLILQVIESPLGIVQIDGRNAHTVAGAANRIRAGLVQGLGHLCDLAALGSQLDEQGDGNGFLYRLDNLCRHIGILAHAGAGLLGSGLAAAAGQLQIIGHIGAAHIQLNDVCAHFFKLLCHIDPAGNALITGIGDVSHQLQVGQHLFGILHQLQTLLEGQTLFCGKGQSITVLENAVTGLTVDIGSGVDAQLDAGSSPAGSFDLHQLPNRLGGRTGSNKEGILKGHAANGDGDLNIRQCLLHTHASSLSFFTFTPSLADL